MTVLYDINLYLARTRMPATLFGRLAVNDPRLVHDLRRGRQPRPAMERRIRDFIARDLATPRSENAVRTGRPCLVSDVTAIRGVIS
ncbi:hypothetical protein ACU5AX_00840 [Sphingomonas sp. XXL09]|uniref:hypothetical protein n=1 Tax=Sphingomonas sp. XXL09 TaxID=3457787 RepID=UPI00406BA83D